MEPTSKPVKFDARGQVVRYRYDHERIMDLLDEGKSLRIVALEADCPRNVVSYVKRHRYRERKYRKLSLSRVHPSLQEFVRLLIAHTSKEFADRAGYDRTTIVKVCTGERFPSFRTILNLAEAMGYSAKLTLEKIDANLDWQKAKNAGRQVPDDGPTAQAEL